MCKDNKGKMIDQTGSMDNCCVKAQIDWTLQTSLNKDDGEWGLMLSIPNSQSNDGALLAIFRRGWLALVLVLLNLSHKGYESSTSTYTPRHTHPILW